MTTESEHLAKLHLAKESRHRQESMGGAGAADDEDDGDDDDDDDDRHDGDEDGGASYGVAAAPAAALAPAAAAETDLLGDMLGGGAPAPAGAADEGDLLGDLPAAGALVELDTMEIITRFATTDKAHVHRDASITIGAIAQFRPKQAAVSAAHPLSEVASSVQRAPDPAYKEL